MEIKRVENGVYVDGELWESKDIERDASEIKNLKEKIMQEIKIQDNAQAKLFELNTIIRQMKASGKVTDTKINEFGEIERRTIEELESDRDETLENLNASKDIYMPEYKKALKSIESRIEREYKDLEKQAQNPEIKTQDKQNKKVENMQNEKQTLKVEEQKTSKIDGGLEIDELTEKIMQEIRIQENSKASILELENKLKYLKQSGKTQLTEYDGTVKTLEDIESDLETAKENLKASKEIYMAEYKSKLNELKEKTENKVKEIENNAEEKGAKNSTEPATKDLKVEPKSADVQTNEDEEKIKQGYEMDEYGVWVKKDVQKVVENSKKQEFARGL